MQICLDKIGRVVDCDRREDEMIITTADPSIRKFWMLRFDRLLGFLKQVNSTCFVFPRFFSPFAKHIGERSVANTEDE